MIVKSGLSNHQIEISDAPKITYNGSWLPWHLEFYGGVLYWEAWFFSSGVLTVEDGYSYTCDAWGIGGGGQANWSPGGGNVSTGTAGIPNMRTNIALSDTVAVSIGAGGENGSEYGSSSDSAGGNTSLGDYLICNGGAVPSGMDNISDTYKRYRFEDADKADESSGGSVAATDKSSTYYAQNGWLKINRTVTTYHNSNYSRAVGAQGDGLGGGGGYYGWSAPGALVVRIPA